MTDETALDVGIRIDPTKGVAFFGLEAVNRILAAGRRVREIRPGGAIVTKLGDDGEHARVAVSGCDIVVVFEEQ